VRDCKIQDYSDHPWMNKCMLDTINMFVFPTNPCLVYHMSWLRTKACFSRWLEELHIVGYEMKWTINWFQWKKDQWRLRLNDTEDEERTPGLDCYCHKQMSLWGSLEHEAETKFTNILGCPLYS
jgi:hypothetical protein